MWVDCEMTGLDLRADALIEVACIVTDADLNPVDEGIDLIIRPEPQQVAGMIDLVRTMHTESGLLDELESGITLAEAQDALLNYLKSWVPEPRRTPLAGSSVYVDRGFLARDLPDFDAHLHYRLIDVSTIKELVRRWYPRVYFAAPEKRGGHRALGDIKDSITELRYYRTALFPPPPGPDSTAARRAADQFR
ncbi:MAG: oligoribonuclease [Candidatus Nanopelagicales bacterium]|nr:oligoribonuclease [Candidatus Nanopelagicales bacterium]